MQVGVLGINHKSAPLWLREQVAHACSSLEASLERLLDKRGVVILSTCNRTEIYFSGNNLADIQSHLFADLKKRINHSSEHAFYSFFGEECFYHLACVTAGIDSKLLAESDIQRQVKLAYVAAKAEGTLSPALHYLFQKALKFAKNARSCFPLFHSTIQLEGLIYQLFDAMLGPTSSLLFIGNSDINRKIIHYFYRRKKGRMTLISRDLAAAHPFALDYGLTLKDRKELMHASSYEGIIAATSTDDFILSSLEENACTRLIVDLSVPRSIDPCIGGHPTLTLLNMEQIGELSAHAHTARHGEISQVKSFLQSSVKSAVQRYVQKTAWVHFSSSMVIAEGE